jgi:hypothetical protein
LSHRLRSFCIVFPFLCPSWHIYATIRMFRVRRHGNCPCPWLISARLFVSLKPHVINIAWKRNKTSQHPTPPSTERYASQSVPSSFIVTPLSLIQSPFFSTSRKTRNTYQCNPSPSRQLLPTLHHLDSRILSPPRRLYIG